MRRLFWIGFALVAGCCIPPAIPPIFTFNGIVAVVDESEISAVIHAEDLSAAAAAYQKLFNRATTDKLRRLQSHPNDSIAIQAAWQEVLKSVPLNPKKGARPDPEKLRRFMEILEERVHGNAPGWWKEAMLDSRASDQGNAYPGGFYDGFVPWFNDPRIKYPNAQKKWPDPPDLASFEKQDGKTVVRVETESALIPNHLPELLRRVGDVSALIRPSRCYVAEHDGFGYGYRLACVDRDKSTVRWVTQVWAAYTGGADGFAKGWVEITEHGDRVVVFGISGGGGFHVEAFRISDGSNIFRFSSYHSIW